MQTFAAKIDHATVRRLAMSKQRRMSKINRTNRASTHALIPVYIVRARVQNDESYLRFTHVYIHLDGLRYIQRVRIAPMTYFRDYKFKTSKCDSVASRFGARPAAFQPHTHRHAIPVVSTRHPIHIHMACECVCVLYVGTYYHIERYIHILSACVSCTRTLSLTSIVACPSDVHRHRQLLNTPHYILQTPPQCT